MPSPQILAQPCKFNGKNINEKIIVRSKKNWNWDLKKNGKNLFHLVTSFFSLFLNKRNPHNAWRERRSYTQESDLSEAAVAVIFGFILLQNSRSPLMNDVQLFAPIPSLKNVVNLVRIVDVDIWIGFESRANSPNIQ